MKIRNMEFKARVASIDTEEKKLLALNPEFRGTDHQTDTYFKVPHGRLKLREGNIEHALIQYHREEKAGAKESSVILFKHFPDPALKQILTLQCGILKVVRKERKIYFLEHVKFHFDRVEGLGEFMEVEVIDESGLITQEALKSQCDHWIQFFGIEAGQFIQASYSDML